MKYPTDKDIEIHIKQFLGSFRQYFRLGGNIDFVRNDLRVLFTDIILETNNSKTQIYGEMNFDKFIRKLNPENKIGCGKVISNPCSNHELKCGQERNNIIQICDKCRELNQPKTKDGM